MQLQREKQAHQRGGEKGGGVRRERSLIIKSCLIKAEDLHHDRQTDRQTELSDGPLNTTIATLACYTCTVCSRAEAVSISAGSSGPNDLLQVMTPVAF